MTKQTYLEILVKSVPIFKIKVSIVKQTPKQTKQKTLCHHEIFAIGLHEIIILRQLDQSVIIFKRLDEVKSSPADRSE